jgi:thiamine phosphate synthase YjbQ (UPF0047 family)
VQVLRHPAHRHRLNEQPAYGSGGQVEDCKICPVLGGRPTFGTWQSVVLVDTNADNPDRKVRLSFIPG